MIRCILIDDERNALEMMEWLIKTYCPQVEIVDMCTSAQQGIESINANKPGCDLPGYRDAAHEWI
jgi:two-component system LytT family response regulator